MMLQLATACKKHGPWSLLQELANPKIQEMLTNYAFVFSESPISSAADNEADVNTSLSDASVASQQANEVNFFLLLWVSSILLSIYGVSILFSRFSLW